MTYTSKEFKKVHGMTRAQRSAAIRKVSFTNNPKEEFEKLTGVKYVNTFTYNIDKNKSRPTNNEVLETSVKVLGVDRFENAVAKGMLKGIQDMKKEYGIR